MDLAIKYCDKHTGKINIDNINADSVNVGNINKNISHIIADTHIAIFYAKIHDAVIFGVKNKGVIDITIPNFQYHKCPIRRVLTEKLGNGNHSYFYDVDAVAAPQADDTALPEHVREGVVHAQGLATAVDLQIQSNAF